MANSTNPKDLPLDALIAPPPVSWWPLAPIWWILIGFTVLAITICLLIFIKKHYPKQHKKVPLAFDTYQATALKELEQLNKPYDQDASLWLEHINILLKRLCQLHYPHEHAHVLLGKKWLDFLNSKCPESNINQHTALIDGGYHRTYSLSKQDIDSLYLAVDTWIKHHV